MDRKGGNAETRRKKLFALADEIGLSRDERIELAQAILWRDITTWKSLDAGQVDRMLDALEGYGKIRWLLTNRTVQPSRHDTEPETRSGRS